MYLEGELLWGTCGLPVTDNFKVHRSVRCFSAKCVTVGGQVVMDPFLMGRGGKTAGMLASLGWDSQGISPVHFTRATSTHNHSWYPATFHLYTAHWEQIMQRRKVMTTLLPLLLLLVLKCHRRAILHRKPLTPSTFSLSFPPLFYNIPFIYCGMM